MISTGCIYWKNPITLLFKMHYINYFEKYNFKKLKSDFSEFLFLSDKLQMKVPDT